MTPPADIRAFQAHKPKHIFQMNEQVLSKEEDINTLECYEVLRNMKKN
jgi:hypothetical protein